MPPKRVYSTAQRNAMAAKRQDNQANRRLWFRDKYPNGAIYNVYEYYLPNRGWTIKAGYFQKFGSKHIPFHLPQDPVFENWVNGGYEPTPASGHLPNPESLAPYGAGLLDDPRGNRRVRVGQEVYQRLQGITEPRHFRSQDMYNELFDEMDEYENEQQKRDRERRELKERLGDKYWEEY